MVGYMLLVYIRVYDKGGKTAAFIHAIDLL